MGEFKGEINKAGRRVGSQNKATKQVRELVQKLFEDNIEKLEQDFLVLKPAERVNAMLKLMSFVLPTLKAVQVTEDDKPEFQAIQIDFTKWK